MRSPLDSIDTSIGTMDFGERGRSVRGAGGTGTTVGAPLNTSVQDIEDQVRYTVNIPKDDGGSEARQLTRKQIESSVLGMTDSNPFGAMSGIARLLGPKNISYPDLIGTPAFGAVKNLMFRRYLSPVDPRTGRVEPGLGVGDPTRYGTVERDPSLRKTGSKSLFPGVGIITALFDRSDLTVPGFPDGQDATAVQEDTAQAVVPPAFTPERQANFQAGIDEVIARSDQILAENAAKRQLAGMPDGLTTFAEIPPAIPEPRIRDFQIQPTGTTFNEPISPPPAPLENPYDEGRKIDEVVDGKGRILGYVDPVYGSDGVTVIDGGYKLPTGSKVIQGIAAGDAGSATLTKSDVGASPLYDSTDVLSPQNIREVFRMPGSSYYEDRAYPVDIIPPPLLMSR